MQAKKLDEDERVEAGRAEAEPVELERNGNLIFDSPSIRLAGRSSEWHFSPMIKVCLDFEAEKKSYSLKQWLAILPNICHRIETHKEKGLSHQGSRCYYFVSG